MSKNKISQKIYLYIREGKIMKRKIRKYGYIAAAALAMSVLFVGCGQEKEPDTQ